MARHGQQRQQQVVVVTGASGGHRPRDGDRVRRQGSRRGPAGPRGERPPGRRQGGGGRRRRARSSSPWTSPTPRRWSAAAATVEEQLGPIDVWVNVAFSSVFAPFWEIGAKEFARVTEVSYLGYVYGTMAALSADARAGPRDDRAGGLGAGLPRHPAADRLLRLQARHPGLPRGAALRAAARAQRRPRDHGPDAGGQHPAVLLAALPAAAPGAAGAARSTSPRSPPRASSTPPTTRGAGSTGSAAARWAPWPPTPSRRACWTVTWPGPASPPSRPTSRRTPTSRPTCGSRSTADEDFGTHGRFDDRSTTRSVQLWASQHHGLLGAAAGAAAAGTALLTRAVRR